MSNRSEQLPHKGINIAALTFRGPGRFFAPDSLLFSTSLIWATALISAIIVSFLIGIPAYQPIALVGGAMILVLLILLELLSIDLGYGLLLSPAPALMIAGFAMTTWNMLIPAVIIGTLLPGLIRRRSQVALMEAGSRALAVALLAPVYRLANCLLYTSRCV